jgi:hypothetical protein
MCDRVMWAVLTGRDACYKVRSGPAGLPNVVRLPRGRDRLRLRGFPVEDVFADSVSYSAISALKSLTVKVGDAW